MYINEETKVLNQFEKEPTTENHLEVDEVKSVPKGELGKRAATIGSAFVGGAVGAAGAEYVQASLQGQESESIPVEDKHSEQTTETRHHVTSAPVAESEVHVDETQSTVVDSNEIPANATLVSSEEPIVNTTEASDSEVRVVGVQAFQNEDGSQAIVAGLELDGDRALVVDVNSDGTMDLFIHDDNGDGQISDDEIHDITADNVSTQAVLDDYALQAGHDDLYLASNDMPDYMNDADAGLMDS